jgi:hypothetical protein
MASEARGSMTATRVQTAATIVGIVFLAVGAMGFIPGITSNFDTIQFAGHHSEAVLLGVFQVSFLHTIVHLLVGVAGLALASPGVVLGNERRGPSATT